MMALWLYRLRLFVCIAIVVFVSGCATIGNPDERDPLEGFNRGVYSFNQIIDKVIFDPIGKIYKAITPDFIDKGITNFFSNLGEISVIANDLLQFKIGQAYMDIARFFFNSTLGILGIFDISSEMGLIKHDEDFGQTLGYWGIDSGPYLVLPFFGASTLRDLTGFVIDGVLSPAFYLKSDELRAGLLSLSYIDIKSDLLSARNLIGDAALDEYEFTKNAYLDRRATQVNDGLLPDFYE